MTNKDIRDIAAYWAVAYTLKAKNTLSGKLVIEEGNVDGNFLDTLAYEQYEELKLHLRPIAALTDDEARHVAGLSERYEPEEVPTLPVYRRGTMIGFEDYPDSGIESDGHFYTGDGSDGNEYFTYNDAAIFSYLQSIGVYVPGTIDEKYVVLIP